MGHGTKIWLSLLAAGALTACGVSYADPAVRGSAEGTRAGEGLSAAARGGITTHGAAPGPGSDSRPSYDEERETAVILPTPRLHVQPYHPEPVGETTEGLVYRTRIDVTNRGGAAVRVPRVALDVELRSADGREGCEVVSMTTAGEPVILPGETVMLDARSICPDVERPHEVVALVELPELTGEDGLVAGRTVVADVR